MLTPTVTNPNTTTRPETAPASTAAATAASDFKSFLSLLTAQLRNQDPLSPLDSTQFVEQLASFSAVEQQIESNRLLKDIAGGLNAPGLETATQWIGKEVEAEAETVHFNGENLNFRLPVGAFGTSNEAIVTDRNGEVIYREDLRAGQNIFSWDGSDNIGFVVPQGDYKVALASSKDGAIVDAKPLNITARVTEARLSNGAMQLILENGTVIEPGAILAVREPAQSDGLPGNI